MLSIGYKKQMLGFNPKQQGSYFACPVSVIPQSVTLTQDRLLWELLILHTHEGAHRDGVGWDHFSLHLTLGSPFT